MYTSPIVAQRTAELHQRELRAAAERSRLSKQACVATAAGAGSQPERIIPMRTLIAAQSLVNALLLSPRAARLAIAAAALVAGAVLGGDVALAGFSTNPG